MMPSETLPVMPVPGLRPDSLGSYVASLGLVRSLANSRWPNVRVAWRNGVLQIVGGPQNMDDMLDDLLEIAQTCSWTPYSRSWADAQKISTKKKSARPLMLWQASADEIELELLNAHAVPAAKISFNPLLGSGGNSGKRSFSKGWKRATDILCQEPPEAAQKRTALRDLLLGDPVAWNAEKLNAASWFSDANKLYNSGQDAFREGAITPWSMALACEGLAFFAGGASRRLGARARAVGAFPFVSLAAAPRSAGEAGHDLYEIWAPLWDRPMSLPEISTLFLRGRAEIHGRGVLTPAAFATAILRRGVDAGIIEFRRFILARTTSSNTFEPRFEGVLHVRHPDRSETRRTPRLVSAASTAMERLLAFADELPVDKKVGKRWRFEGLRGGIEAAMIRAAESPSNAEVLRDLLDSVVTALDRIDRNKRFRERRIRWQPLPLDWLPAMLGGDAPGTEARLALSLVSSFRADLPLALYRFGVEQAGKQSFVHPPETPKRWVWRTETRTPQALSAILIRRVLDWEADRQQMEPVRTGVPATNAHVTQWLLGTIDDALLASWISRLALFDWQQIPREVRSLATASSKAFPIAGTLCLFGLLHPLLDVKPVKSTGQVHPNLLPPESGARTPAAARRLLGLLMARDADGAVRFAQTRYRMADAPVAKNDILWNSNDTERLAASLQFSVSDDERSTLVERWLRPRREQRGSF